VLKVKLGLVLLVLLTLLFALPLFEPNNSTDTQDNVFSLNAPPAAYAEGVGSYLDDEVGISAYVQLPTTIDFIYISNLFRTIELETDDYLIGSIAVSGYDESHDVHVYVHSSGWVLAYYLDMAPVGKIIDWTGYNGSVVPTKLERVITTVANALQVPVPDVTFYDFRYPDANKMMVIVDGQYGNGSDTFQVNLPADFVVYQRSWFIGSDVGWFNYGDYYLNGVFIHRITQGYNQPYIHNASGFFTEQQLPPEIFHTVKLEVAQTNTCSCKTIGGLALVYQEPVP
jgi:hypothetical protein